MNNLLFARALLVSSAMATACITAQPAYAQVTAGASDSGLGEIVVLARKRAENVQDVPIAITAMSGSDLQERGIARVADLVGNVPNLTQDGGGSVMGAFGIRGIVSQTRNIGFDSGMGVYVDGVLTVRANGGDQELPDIATVEVLRGPQGTLFGRNTTAGAINITTRKPSLSEPEMEGRFAMGNLGLMEGSFYASAPVVNDTLGIKVAGSIAKRDGYIFNTIDGKNYNGVNRKTVRGGLSWEPTSDITVALTGSYLKQEDSLLAWQFSPNGPQGLAGLGGESSDPYVINQNEPSAQNREVWSTNLNIDYKLGDYMLTSISAYGANRSVVYDDDDGTPLPISASNFLDGADQFTQELRLASPTTGNFDYLIGLYYLYQDANSDRHTFIFGPPGAPGAFLGDVRGVSRLKTNAYAAFTSFNWRPADRLTISGGLRYNSETKEINFRQTNSTFIPFPALTALIKRTDKNVSGNASIKFAPDDNTHIYASVSRGFKSGGYNPDIVSDTDISFAPESVWAYEAGVKSELFDRRLRVNAAAFYTDYKDLQVSTLVGAGFQIRNAASAKIKGFELEVTAKPVSIIEFNLGLGYTDATYDNFPGCNAGLNCAGLRLPYVPKWTVSGGVQLNLPVGSGEVSARIDANYRSNIYYEAFNAPDGRLPGYTLVNARLGYRATDSRWGIAAFARNLFDKRYRDFTFFIAPFSQRYDRWAPPSTYGAEVTFKF